MCNKKQPPEVFYKKAARKISSSHTSVLAIKKLLEKCINIHLKIPVLETLFNPIAGRQVYKFIKKRF